MDGFQRRREAKKTDILQAAIELFSTKGLKDTSIADIAENAGVSQVSIYNFFESKDSLARLAFIKYMDEKMVQSEQLLNSDLSFPEKFKEMILETDKTGQSLSEEFFQSYVWNDPMIQSYYQGKYYDRGNRLFLNLIEQGKNEGYVDADISIDAVLMYVGIFKNMLAQPNISKKIRLDISKLFFYGILGKDIE
jgi:AcrR family transcriptional regulator